MDVPTNKDGKNNLVHHKHECHRTNESPKSQLLRTVATRLIKKKAKIQYERAKALVPKERLPTVLSLRKKPMQANSSSTEADIPISKSKQPSQSISQPLKNAHLSSLETDTEADSSILKPVNKAQFSSLNTDTEADTSILTSPTKINNSSVKPAKQAGSSSKNPPTKASSSSKISSTVADTYAKQYGPDVAATKSLEGHPQHQIPPELTKVSNDILQNAVSAFTNMHIAHEICINPEYRIKPPEKVDTLETEIQRSLRKAFWDIIDEDLKGEVPKYDKIPGVIHDLRNTLLGLLLPHNDYVRAQIEETLDMVEIQREIDLDILDFTKYVHFICNILLKICSPIRDRQINAIAMMEQPSVIFKSLFDVMECMQLDMANYLVSVFRPTILKHSVQYEREKFCQFLTLEYKMRIDGLAETRKWFNRHFMSGRRTPTQIAKAFSEFVNWNFDTAWPETVALDGLRISEICQGLRRSTFIGAMVLTVSEFCKPLFNQENRKVVPGLITLDMNKQFQVLLCLENVTFPDKLADDVASCAEEAVKIVGNYLEKYENKTIPNTVKQLLRQSVTKVLDDDNTIRSLIRGRIVQYLEDTVFSENKYKVPIPPGLNVIKLDVELLVSRFARIVYHNRMVFNDVYVDIIESNCLVPQFGEGPDESGFPKYLKNMIEACKQPSKSFPMKKEELQCIKNPPTVLPDVIKSEPPKMEAKEVIDLVKGRHSEDDLIKLPKTAEEGQKLPKGRVDDLEEKCEALSLVNAHQGSDVVPDVSSSVLTTDSTHTSGSLDKVAHSS